MIFGNWHGYVRGILVLRLQPASGGLVLSVDLFF